MADVPARMVPALTIQRGHAVVPGPRGPVVIEDRNGRPVDLLDLGDRLLAEFGRLYVIDLDGIDRNSPQLDYLQEMSRDGELWVDAGVKNADQAIDVLVAGATRAVLSTSELRSADELPRAWSLSTDIVLEVDTSDLPSSGLLPTWEVTPEAAAVRGRAAGPSEIVLRFGDSGPAWDLLRRVGASGPTWAAGPIAPSDLRTLSAAGAAGGIFPYQPPAEDPLPVVGPTRAHDDES